MTSRTRNVVVLGSTGSIGTQTLDVVERLQVAGIPLRVIGLAAGSNVELLERQIERVRPDVVSVLSEPHAHRLEARFPRLRVVSGEDGPNILASESGADVVVNALVGAAGLRPTLAGVSRGCVVALANKESLVIGGSLVRAALRQGRGRILPIDSEHSAVLQCLDGGRRQDVRRVILTASGGPFRDADPSELARVTPQDALRHPTWAMGTRITIDSATMVNKAFEVIEAHHLFGVSLDEVSVVLHPSSLIHSLVEYRDGSILAQLASHDMRIPIQYALTYPDRQATELPRLDFSVPLAFEFRPLDPARYPAFATVLAAARAGGSAPAALNGADEVLVRRFLGGEIPFPGIAAGLATVLDRWSAEVGDPQNPEGGLTELFAADRWARTLAEELSWP
ncbi:MAG: 1-deoxy-D-xylulose-5-phosphate reductoisomerase [Candidatus Bipolaricaulia bacterium]